MLGAVVIVQETEPADPESVERAVAALAPECDPVLVFGGGGRAGEYARPLRRAAGELPVLATVLGEAGDGHAAVLAADLTHPSSELVRYMARIRGSFDIVAPQRHDGSLQPLLALYRGSLRRRAEGLLAAGEHGIRPLLEIATVRRVSVEEVAKFGDPECLLERAAPSS